MSLGKCMTETAFKLDTINPVSSVYSRINAWSGLSPASINPPIPFQSICFGEYLIRANSTFWSWIRYPTVPWRSMIKSYSRMPGMHLG